MSRTNGRGDFSDATGGDRSPDHARRRRLAPPDVRRTDESVERLSAVLGQMTALIDGSIRSLLTAQERVQQARTSLGGALLQQADERLDEAFLALDQVAELVHGSLQGPGLSLGSELLSGAAPVTLGQAVEHCVELVRPRCEAERIRVEVDLADAARDQPAGLLYAVLLHGVRNAVEAVAAAGRRSPSGAPPGGLIRICAEREPGRTERGRAIPERTSVTISDDGEGLPEGFDPDELFDSTVSTKGDGRGMGLALCRTLIERAGGRIQIARGSGQGSRPGAVLTIGVPAAPAASRLLPGGGSEGR